MPWSSFLYIDPTTGAPPLDGATAVCSPLGDGGVMGNAHWMGTWGCQTGDQGQDCVDAHGTIKFDSPTATTGICVIPLAANGMLEGYKGWVRTAGPSQAAECTTAAVDFHAGDWTDCMTTKVHDQYCQRGDSCYWDVGESNCLSCTQDSSPRADATCMKHTTPAACGISTMPSVEGSNKSCAVDGGKYYMCIDNS
jgi:hypothetical protein